MSPQEVQPSIDGLLYVAVPDAMTREAFERMKKELKRLQKRLGYVYPIPIFEGGARLCVASSEDISGLLPVLELMAGVASKLLDMKPASADANSPRSESGRTEQTVDAGASA